MSRKDMLITRPNKKIIYYLRNGKVQKEEA